MVSQVAVNRLSSFSNQKKSEEIKTGENCYYIYQYNP